MDQNLKENNTAVMKRGGVKRDATCKERLLTKKDDNKEAAAPASTKKEKDKSAAGVSAITVF